tara:strand:- start:86 stop:295 length:210 start_codon:yes stop_codon:yes gene_type:complete
LGVGIINQEREGTMKLLREMTTQELQDQREDKNFDYVSAVIDCNVPMRMVEMYRMELVDLDDEIQRRSV